MTTKSSAASKGKLFELRGPGVVVFPTGASFAVNVPKQGDMSVEVATGQVGIGFVSLQGKSAVPVAVPELAAPKGINIPAVPSGTENTEAVGEMLERVAAAVPALAKGEATIEGVDYRQATDAGIVHYVGDSLNGIPLVAPPPVRSHTVTNTKTIEESVVVPGTATVVITDKQLAESIPAGIPGNPKVHILPGGVFQVEYYGVTAICNINIVDGRAEIQGLPFGIDPPQIEDAIKKNIRMQELPALLSIESKDGEATITYATDVMVTRTTVVTEEIEVPDAIPHTSPYFSSIPTPREISTDWKVVGSNSLMALVITLLVSALAAPVNGFVKENEGRILGAYSPIVKGTRSVWRLIATLGRLLRWCSPGPLTRGVWLMFIFGAIYSFLAVGRGLLSPSGLTILLTLSFTSGFMALYLPWIKSFVARRMKVDAKVGLNPGQLTVAAVTVGLSRVFAFTPGLMLGSPSGLKMPAGGLTEKQEFRIEISGLVSFAVLAALSWGLVFLVVQMSAEPWAAGSFKTAKGFVSGLQDWGLVVFAMSVQALFFSLLPRPQSFSWSFMQKHAAVWGASFALASFVFIHTQLNKQKTILDLTPNMIVTAVVVAVLAILVLGY
ncbi:MAG: hypothetical protein HW388_18 [Dehalococcoidia bacterium]|nr:hypothetical protein [Dehalococcoidia bacterium]